MKTESGNPERKSAALLWALVAWAGVALAGLLANRLGPVWNTLFFLAALGLPWLVPPRPPARRLAAARPGWGLAGAGSALVLGLPPLILFLAIRWYLQALFLHPGGGAALGFLAERAAFLLPVAVAEEYFFRGWLQETVLAGRWGNKGLGLLTRKNLATALLFGLAHGISHLQPLFFIQILGGLVLGGLMERSGGSVWPAVLLHAAASLSAAWLTLLIGMNWP